MTTPSEFTELEQLVKQYAGDRRVLEDRTRDLQDETKAMQRRRLPGIKSAADAAIDSRDAIKRYLASHTELFIGKGKTKTITLHGIKVGIVKGSGKVVISDPERTVDAIRRYFKDDADRYIETKYSPIKSALKGLKAVVLAKLGCTLTDTDEAPLVKPANDNIDKIVEKILGETENS